MSLRLTSSLLAAIALVFFAPLACAQTPGTPATTGTPTLEEDPDLVRTYAETITASDLAAHLYVFASDYFEGRETAQPGQKLAATYLAGQYRKMGLAPKGTAGTDDPFAPEAYFQPFELDEEYVRRATLTGTVGTEPVVTSTFTPEAQDGAAYFARGAGGTAEGGLLFAGYGIAEENFDELAALRDAGLSADGRWVLILADEPLAEDGRSLLAADGEPTDNATSWFTKYVRFFRSGLGTPAGFLVVSDASPRQPMPMTMQAAAQASTLGALSLPGAERRSGGGSFPPIFHVSSATADALLAPAGRTVAALQQQIDRTLEPVVFEVEGATVRGEVEKDTRRITTENVLAFIEGTDLKDEVVVLSSHYDHVGVDPLAVGDGIYNGADDDGSGTVAILEMAEAFAKAKRDGHGPRRSLLFLNVSAEEKGLLGSAYYADVEPVFPLENTVTNLNIDMIGRYDPTHPGPDTDYVYLIGSKIVSDDLDRISTMANRLAGTGLDLNDRFNSADDPNQFYRRSDHWNFGKHRIPFIFYFTGTHEDYHGVGDHPDKIDYERMARISRLIFSTAWQIANQDARPQISGAGFWED